MRKLDVECLAILWVNLHGKWLSDCELRAQQVDLDSMVSAVSSEMVLPRLPYLLG